MLLLDLLLFQVALQFLILSNTPKPLRCLHKCSSVSNILLGRPRLATSRFRHGINFSVSRLGRSLRCTAHVKLHVNNAR